MELRIVSGAIHAVSFLIHLGLLSLIVSQVSSLSSSQQGTKKSHQSSQHKKNNDSTSPSPSSTPKHGTSFFSKLAEASLLIKIQFATVLSVLPNTVLTLYTDIWVQDSDVACNVLRKTLTTTKICIFLLFNLFLYNKALTVSFEDKQRENVKRMIQGCLAGLAVSIILAPFLSYGQLMNGYCAYQVNWIYALLGVIGFANTSIVFTLWFMKPVMETYKNRKKLETGPKSASDDENRTAEVGAASGDVMVSNSVRHAVRKVIWLNFLSCVMMNMSIGLSMLYMSVVMAKFDNVWQPRYMVGSVSSLEAIFSSCAMLLCTVQSYKCAGCFGVSAANGKNASSTGDALSPVADAAPGVVIPDQRQDSTRENRRGSYHENDGIALDKISGV